MTWNIRERNCLIAFTSMNIEGIRNLSRPEITEKLQKYDFISLQETWSTKNNISNNFSFPGYECEFKHSINRRSAGRGSGGIMFLYRSKYAHAVSVISTKNNYPQHHVLPCIRLVLCISVVCFDCCLLCRAGCFTLRRVGGFRSIKIGPFWTEFVLHYFLSLFVPSWTVLSLC